jgi:hypothetical protein
MNLQHSTLSQNTGNGAGGGLFLQSPGILNITTTIIAGNIDPGGNRVDIYLNPTGPTLNVSGTNLIGSNESVSTQFPVGPLVGTLTTPLNPLLAPLGNYGATTQTMALLPGSPARNAATVLSPAITSDQRLFPVVGTPDLGAYEAGNTTNYNAWIWETLPATATAPQHATTFDFDSDGQSNGAEWAALTNPTAVNSPVAATGVRNGANLDITVPTVLNRTYTLQQSATLLGGSWTAVSGTSPRAGTGNPTIFQVPISSTRMLYRVQINVP